MKQIAEERDAEWESNRKEKNPSERSTFKARIKAALKKKDQGIVGRDDDENESAQAAPELLKQVATAKPRFIEPMKARLVDNPPTARRLAL